MRDKEIIRVSIIGIITNLALAGFKALAGMMSNSIAITMDAVNNASDAISQIVTIIGTILAGKRADEKHPYGYGRIEYISAVILAAVVLLAGFTAAKESVVKIFHPETASYTPITLVIIIVGILVKLVWGRFVKKQGERLQAQALIAAGTDSSMDAILSTSTLVAALINLVLHIQLEGILGLILSVFILKAGYEILIGTLDSIIGERADQELIDGIKARIRQFPGVNGAYDLHLHNYGPNMIIGSVHIEVDDQMTAKQIHQISRRIIGTVMREFQVILTVGIYASNTSGGPEEAAKMEIAKKVFEHPEVIQMHAFYIDYEEKYLTFDVIMSHKTHNAHDIVGEIKKTVQEMYPDYHIDVALDLNVSD